MKIQSASRTKSKKTQISVQNLPQSLSPALSKNSASIDLRIQLHRDGQKFLRSGKHGQAIGIFESALRDHGSHLGLLSDLCAAQYLDGRYRDFRRNLVVLRNEYIDNSERLSEASRLKTRIRLSNFLEEEGQISEALALLRAGDRDAEKSDDQSYYRFLAHRLRISSMLYIKDADVFADYSTLLRLREHQPDAYFSVEIQHALMLAEAAFFSPATAFNRLIEAAHTSMLDTDLSLMNFDFAEEFLISGERLDPEATLGIGDTLKKMIKTTKASSRFETLIKKMLIASSASPKVLAKTISEIEAELQKPSEDSSFSAILRATYVAQLLAQESGLRRRLAHRLDFLLRSLDERSQKLWRRKFSQSPLEASSIDVGWNARESTLSFEQKDLNLASKPAIAKLMQIISHSTSQSTAEIIDLIWNAPNDEAYYRRLRTLITRLNRSLFELTGEINLIAINVDRVAHSPKLKIS